MWSLGLCGNIRKPTFKKRQLWFQPSLQILCVPFLSFWTCQYLNRLTKWKSDKSFLDELKFYFVDKFKILGACSILLMRHNFSETVSSSNLGSLYFGHKQMIQWSKGFMQILFLWMRALTTKSSKSSLDAWVGEATNLIKTPLFAQRVSFLPKYLRSELAFMLLSTK